METIDPYRRRRRTKSEVDLLFLRAMAYRSDPDCTLNDKEIAEKVGMNENTLRVRLYRKRQEKGSAQA